MIKTLALICMTILFSGCSQDSIVTPDLATKIDNILNIQTPKSTCKYPKLPIYSVPKIRKVPKSMTLEDAFKAQNRVNKILRFTCKKYERVAIETNKRYQGE